ncbi:MAG: MFS transporter [Propionibacteriaceae bacterium]|nr:MFS transporter [Propionibacteriaceae bacterium]
MSRNPPTPPEHGHGEKTDFGLIMHSGGWIEGWDPENTAQWEGIGSKIAKRNLGLSIYAEFLGFVVWQLWSIVVVLLNSNYYFNFTDSQQFWLISIPALVGATLRFPYTFMVTAIGGRNWTIVSAALLLIPTTAMGFAISNHPVVDPTTGAMTGGTPYAAMVAIAALGGFGGGNFASSMANINFFYPHKTKGWALGLNAAGGNIGAAIAQFTVPILVTITAASLTFTHPESSNTQYSQRQIWNLPLAGWFWIPFIIVAMIGAWWGMNNLLSARADSTAYREALKEPHLWLLSFLYIGTFGSFIGLASAFPKLINDQFPSFSTVNLQVAFVGLAFLGPLTGSLVRPVGGKLADKLGGASVTLVAFLVMIVATFASINVLRLAHEQGNHSPSYFWLFLGCFLTLFAATGVGNGSMYKMITTVFAEKALRVHARDATQAISTIRKTSAALGLVSAFGAYGGFMIPQVFNKATSLKKAELTSEGPWVVEGYQLGLSWLLGAYAVFAAVLVVFYILPYRRRGMRV